MDDKEKFKIVARKISECKEDIMLLHVDLKLPRPSVYIEVNYDVKNKNGIEVNYNVKSNSQ